MVKAQSVQSSRWKPRDVVVDPVFVRTLNRQLQIKGERPIHPVVAKHLISIGCQTVNEALKFLFPQAKDLHAPFLMKGMRALVLALEEDIIQERFIAVVGDYDVDGIMATYILYETLKELGAKVCYYIPHRKTEGYGMKSTIVETLHSQGVETIVTVDNGISAHEAIKTAKEKGMKVYITDHHTPPPELPEADIVVNPHQKGCRYPFKGLCGGAIAYKLAEALYEQFGYDPSHVEQFSEHVTLCTIADVMPIVDENRFLVKRGLEKMKEKPSRFVKALGRALGVDTKTMTETSIGFYLAPALNAPGRLDTSQVVMDLLLSENWMHAILQANICKSLNDQRKRLVDEALELAKTQLTQDPVQVLLLPIEEGIAGIVAGRVKEETGCPTFIFTESKDESGNPIFKGSARSGHFPLYEALKEVALNHPDWFKNWGGHQKAAGLSMTCNLQEFHQALISVYPTIMATLPDEESYYLMEVAEDELPSISYEMERLAPFGEGHRRPILAVETEIISVGTFGPELNHLRLHSKEDVEYTKFRGTHLSVQTGYQRLYITAGRSTFAGRNKMDLLVEDIEEC